MRVHHLNAISTCPLGGKLMDDGPESIVARGHLTNHCLLIETMDSLVLVDTGLGLRDVAEPHSRLSRFFLNLVSPDFREEMTACRQLARMGFDPADVRHIVLTHLEFDHAGGLDDFPNAVVHMLETERDAAFAQATWLDRQRFRPQQWSSLANWHVYRPGDGEAWFGFNRVRALEGITEDVALIPLLGHTLGHAGVAVRTDDRWLFQTGDAYFFHGEMDVANPHCTPGLAFYQRMMDKDHKARVWNQDRLRELRRTRAYEVEIFCAHDVVEFERLAGRSAEVPADRIVPRGRSGTISEHRAYGH
jgi:glyoxylase-like metal-dependent hydrolase (beta-lactamase superfamily II)